MFIVESFGTRAYRCEPWYHFEFYIFECMIEDIQSGTFK